MVGFVVDVVFLWWCCFLCIPAQFLQVVLFFFLLLLWSFLSHLLHDFVSFNSCACVVEKR